jgi:hypothetical protein
MNVQLPANLETRRKRRESNTRFDARKINVFDAASPEKVRPATSTIDTRTATSGIKAGAKRKLSAREGHPQVNEKATNPAEDFHYGRKTVPGREDAAANAARSETVRPTKMGSRESEKNDNKTSKNAGLDARRVLSASMFALNSYSLHFAYRVLETPNLSPRKAHPDSLRCTNDKDLKKPLHKTRINHEPSQPIKISSIEEPPPRDPGSIADRTSNQAPKTPGLSDLLSPPSTQPSTARDESRDTPPPSDLNSNGIVGRAARRARAPVNYAEPNLVSKMRRPGKELADAVTEKKRQDGLKTEFPCSTAVKSEETEENWKVLPASNRLEPQSPLDSKSSTPTRIPQPAAANASDESPTSKPGVDGARSSALALASRRRRERAGQLDELNGTADKLNGLQIYDFDDTSTVDANAMTSHANDVQVKLARRRSLIQSTGNAAKAERPSSMTTKASEETWSTRRNQGLTDDSQLKSDGTSARIERDGQASRKETEEMDGVFGEIAGVEAGRSARAARRRSMML